MMNTLTDKLAQKQLAIEGKPLGPGSHTEHEGKTMTGAQAIIASLEAEGVDTVFGYPVARPSKFTTRCTTARSCTMCSPATNRVPRTWPTATRAPRARLALCW